MKVYKDHFFSVCAEVDETFGDIQEDQFTKAFWQTLNEK